MQHHTACATCATVECSHHHTTTTTTTDPGNVHRPPPPLVSCRRGGTTGAEWPSSTCKRLPWQRQHLQIWRSSRVRWRSSAGCGTSTSCSATAVASSRQRCEARGFECLAHAECVGGGLGDGGGAEKGGEGLSHCAHPSRSQAESRPDGVPSSNAQWPHDPIPAGRSRR